MICWQVCIALYINFLLWLMCISMWLLLLVNQTSILLQALAPLGIGVASGEQVGFCADSRTDSVPWTDPFSSRSVTTEWCLSSSSRPERCSLCRSTAVGWEASTRTWLCCWWPTSSKVARSFDCNSQKISRINVFLQLYLYKSMFRYNSLLDYK